MESAHLPYNALITRSPKLPWELIEHIIDICSGDAPTLCSLARTCHQLHPRSTFVLFSNVSLRSNRQSQKLEDAIHSRPHLGPLVQHLSYECKDPVPFPLLSMLPRLHHLTILTGSFRYFGENEHPISSVRSLRSLTIRQTFFESLAAVYDFLSAFPNLEDLVCDRVEMQGILPAPGMAQLQLRLRTLNVHEHYETSDPSELESFLEAARLTTAGPYSIRDRTRYDYLTSFTWKFSVEKIHDSGRITLLRNLYKTSIRDLTLVIYSDDVFQLYSTLCLNVNTQGTLEAWVEALNGCPSHHVYFTVPDGVALNMRKEIIWIEDIRRSLCPMLCNWELQDIRYSENPGHDRAIRALTVSSDGRWVATGSSDHTIILWDAQTGCILQEWIVDDNVSALSFSPDGHRLASCQGWYRQNLSIWDISGRAYKRCTVHNELYWCCFLKWSSNGSFLTACGFGSYLVLRTQGENFKQIFSNENDDRDKGRQLVISPDNRWLLLFNKRSNCICDLESNTSLDFPPETGLTVAVFSHSSSHLAAHVGDRIILWEVATRTETARIAHSEQIYKLAFSRDDRLLLGSGLDASIWDARTGAMVRSLEREGKSREVPCFSPCGTYIASVAHATTIKLWRASDGLCLATLSDHGANITQLAFTPDGNMLWSAAHNGIVLARRIQDIVANASAAEE